MKKFGSIIFLLLSILCSWQVSAQISVSGSSGCNTTYSTLKAACDCLNGTSQTGNTVAVSVTGNTTESATISITGSSGMWNRLTIKPSGGAARSITASSLNAPLIQINGGDNVVFDGLNTGSNSLTIDNPNTGTSATAITFSNDATYDTLQNLIIKGSGTSTSGVGVITFDQSSGSTGNDYCYISSSKIGPSGTNLPTYGITTLSGTVSSDYISIVNSQIFDYYASTADQAGIFIFTSSSASNWTISGNSFYQTGSRALSGSSNEASAIRINNTSGNGFVISGNYIGGTSASCGGSAMTYTGSGVFRAMRLLVGTTSATSVQGNVCQNISHTSSSTSTAQGLLSLTGGAFNIGTVTGNTLGLSGSSNSVSVSLSNAAGTFAAISFVSGGTFGNSTVSQNVMTGISLTSSTGLLKGIWLQGSSGILTITGNSFGSYGLNNGINSAANNSTILIHALNTASGQHTISTNSIYGITTSSTGTSSVLTGILTSGTGSFSIKGNMIENIYCASRNLGTGSGAALIGIAATSTGNNDTVSGNLIHDLYEEAPSQGISMVGIHGNFGTATGVQVYNNQIYSHSIVSTSASATMTGINIAGGTAFYYYNTVQMGYLPSGLDNAKNCIIYGINEGSGTNNFYNNTVYVGGSVGVSSSAATYAFASAVTVNTRAVKNNIFINNRSNGSGGTGVHTVYKISSTNPTGLSSDYNIYYSSSTGSGGRLFMASSTAYTSIKAFREAMFNNSPSILNDLHSGVAYPNLISPDNGSCCVDMHIQNSSSAEGMGTLLNTYTTDFEGDVLNSNTPTDIGADAGSYTFATTDDIFVPNFSFTSLASTSLTSNRSVTVTITDQGNGIYRNPSGNVPRIWWRRTYPTTSSWFSNKGTFVSGTANNAVYSFSINYSANSITPIVGDSFAYYFVAMDSISDNVWYSSFYGASHSDPATQSTAPSLYTAYKIVNGLSGNYNVGSGQTYTSLTGASGFFNYVNSNALSGNVTATIVSDLSEDGTNALNQFLDDGGNTYKLTIQSDGTLRTISNSANLSNKMIRIDGADRVIIDGGSKKLRFRNTHSTSASGHSTIMFTNGATADTLRNCIVECNTTQSNNAVVYADVNGTNYVYIASNQLRSPTGGTTNFPTYGFLQRGTSYVNVVNNEIFNNNSVGVYYTGTVSGNTISGNSIYDTAASSFNKYGIQIDDADSFVVNGNYIGGTAANCGGSAGTYTSSPATFFGIYYNTGVDGNNYCYTYNNTIQNINLNGTGTSTFYGIYVSPSSASKHMIGNTSGNGNTIGHSSVSNSISVGSGTGNPTVIGINLAVGTTLYANSVSNNTISNITLPGTGASTGRFCGISFVSSNASTIADTIQGNTISNASNNGTGTGGTSNSMMMGIMCGSTSTTATMLIKSNTIFGLSSTTTSAVQTQVRGIGLFNSSPTTQVIKNRIYNLTNTATSASQPTIAGILSTATASTILCYNNQIYISNASNTNDVAITGIGLTAVGTQAQKLYYNTIVIDGSQSSGSASSIPLSISGASVTSRSYNNILFNKRSGGSGNHLATGVGTPGSSNSSNYNLYIADGSNVGTYNGTAYTFANWKTNTGSDANTWYGTTSTIPRDSLFTSISTGNLNIRTDRTACWAVNGKGMAGSSTDNVSEDYSGETRGTTFGYGTDIGSDEFTPVADPPIATPSGSPANNTTISYTWLGRNIGSITWGNAGTVPSSLNMTYYTGSTPPNPTQNGTRPNAKYMNCYWQCSATGGSGFSYNINLYYDSALIGSVKYSSERRLKLAKKTDVTNSSWSLLNASTVDSSTNILSVSGLTSFSVFAASDSGSASLEALPIQWLSMKGERKDLYIDLQWECVSSGGLHQYMIERSIDGKDYVSIGEMEGKTQQSKYIYSDLLNDGLLKNNGLYYRVKAYNSFEEIYSSVCFVPLVKYAASDIGIQQQGNYLAVNLSQNESADLYITDMTGRKVFQTKCIGKTMISLSDFLPGMYIVSTSGMDAPQKIIVSK